MTAILIFLVVHMLLCIAQTSATDVLHCVGKSQSDGQIHLTMLHNITKDSSDCETQLLVNDTLAAYSSGQESKFQKPVLNMTTNTAILQNWPPQLECLVICLSLNIHEKKPCFYNATPLNSTTRPEVGSSNWKTGVWIAILLSVIAVIIVVGSIALYKKRHKYSSARSEEDTL